MPTDSVTALLRWHPGRRDWIWPLLAALVPALAAHAAYLWSISEGWVPACLPYVEGCTSISRAARHGSGNLLFKLLMLPCAVLQGWLWWRAAAQYGSVAGAIDRSLRVLGLFAALALACYVAFLGVEGDFSRWLRRYGALLYFASSFLAMMLYLRAAWRGAPRRWPLQLMFVSCGLLWVLGLTSTGVSALSSDPQLKDRLENAIEWQLGALFSLWFLALAAHWRQLGR